MAKKDYLEKIFKEAGLVPQNISGRVSLLVDLTGVRNFSLGREYPGKFNLTNLNKIPKKRLPTLYQDLKSLYHRLGIRVYKR